jgi:hypothetical protein
VLLETPTVYEFGTPVLGTFPPWRDPYYWFAGINPHFDLRGQLRVLKTNAKILEEEASGLDQGFVYGFLILLCMSSDKRLIGRIVAKQWFLLLPSIGALAMFSVVLVQDRYVAPYPIVIGLVVFSSVAVMRSANSLKLVYVTVLVAAALFAASSARPAAGELLSFARSLHENKILSRGGPWHVSTEAVGDALRARGLQRGDRVAYIGGSGDFYWARLAGLQVNAEIRQGGADNSGLNHSVDIYWASPSDLKERVDRILYKAGSKAIVTDVFPAGSATNGWDPVAGTSFYIHLLPDHAESDGK